MKLFSLYNLLSVDIFRKKNVILRIMNFMKQKYSFDVPKYEPSQEAFIYSVNLRTFSSKSK